VIENEFSEYESRDRATIFGPDLDNPILLLALFSNGCDLCWQWSHRARVQACSHPTVDWWRTKTDVSVQVRLRKKAALYSGWF
jgi:hypothetical protein